MHDLVTVRRAGKREWTACAGSVSYETPLLYPVSFASGQRLFALRLAFDLTSHARQARFIAVFVRVRFDDTRTTAVQLEAEGAQPTSVDGVQEHHFGWFFGGFDRRADLGTRYVVKAVIDAPVDLQTITGTVRVDASLARADLRHRVDHATARDTIRLALRSAGSLLMPAVRLCLAADIERSSRFRMPEDTAAQAIFVRVMGDARKRAGIETAQVEIEHSGKGQIAVLPPAIDESQVIPLFIEGLITALARANAGRATQDRIQIRVALDRGLITFGASGWVGDPPATVQRLLDSSAAHQAMVDNPGSDVSLILSDVVYRDVIAHGYRNLSAQEFHLVQVNMPAENFTELAWLAVL